jgi:hypothetical protein
VLDLRLKLEYNLELTCNVNLSLRVIDLILRPRSRVNSPAMLTWTYSAKKTCGLRVQAQELTYRALMEGFEKVVRLQ